MKLTIVAIAICLFTLPAASDSNTLHQHQIDHTDASTIWRATRPVPSGRNQKQEKDWHPFTAESAVLFIFLGLGGISLLGWRRELASRPPRFKGGPRQLPKECAPSSCQP